MTPGAVVAQLTQIVSGPTERTDAEIHHALIEFGVPLEIAERALKFTQIA